MCSMCGGSHIPFRSSREAVLLYCHEAQFYSSVGASIDGAGECMDVVSLCWQKVTVCL